MATVPMHTSGSLKYEQTWLAREGEREIECDCELKWWVPIQSYKTRLCDVYLLSLELDDVAFATGNTIPCEEKKEMKRRWLKVLSALC